MDRLLTLDDAASAMRLSTGETFARFARRHGILLVIFGGRVVRVRMADLERAVRAHTVGLDPGRPSGSVFTQTSAEPDINP